MKALYYVGNKQMEIREIPIPIPKANEYLIKIDACGVCGSDIEGYLGKTGRRIAPMIMGHECAGTIVQVPTDGVYKAGTKVALFPKYFCGTCDTCKGGHVNLCPGADFLGAMDCNGAMTEYICVREKYLIPYEGVGADIVSLAEPAAVAYSGIFKLSDEQISKANNILVVGAGTIGLMATLWLKSRGAKRIIVSDASDFRLELAKSIGADAAFNPVACNLEEKILELTGGTMCDLSVEAVGISPTAQASVDALKMAGHSIWIGNAAKMVSINMQNVVTKELSIKGSYIYSLQDFTECVRLLSKKAIDVTPFITHHMDMSQGVQAFDLLTDNKEGKAVKVVLTNE